MIEQLTNGEREYLLKIARLTLEKHLSDGEVFEPQIGNQRLWLKRGAFVTLKKAGQLRGCIGYIEPLEALIIAVRDNAIAAANDPRFLPVTAAELGKIKIEISVLTVPEEVKFKDIKKGDGVIIKKGINSATYLPQVWEDLPQKEVFFGTLCQKAGLEADCYKEPDMDFYRYQAEVFGE
jgi:AmmeMemoRadiSam system protein A